jgi:membrane protease YdiL (CAAX protease family)
LLAWGFTWLGLATRAAAETQALAQGTSPIAFDFADTGQLIGRRAEGALELQSVDDGIELLVGAQQGVNIGLNFRGRELDLQRFPDLRLVLELSAAGRFTPILEDRGGKRWTALDSVELVKGLNPLRIDLAQLRWTLGVVGDPPVDAADAPGRISTLRLYIGAAADTRVLLREARFYALDEPLVRFTLSDVLQTPERWLHDVDGVRRAAPETIVQPPGFPESRSIRASTWRWVTAALAALVCAAAVWAVQRRGAVATRAVLCWSLLAFPVLALWIGDDPSWALLAFAGIAALIGLQRLPPPPVARSVLRAWLAAVLLTALALLGLSLLPGAQVSVGLPDRPWVYLLWALLQQAVLQRVLYARLRKSLSPRSAAWVAALGFALWHTPNLGLMLLTLLGGRLWCELYERHGRLAPLVFSHTVIGLLALQWLAPAVVRSAEVSARFLGAW